MNLTKVGRENIEAWVGGARLIANKGGTRSGKTYSLVSFFVSLCLTNKKKRMIDIVSESLPHLKRGAINDIEDILTNEHRVEGIDYEYNRSDKVFTFKTGSSIRFFSADDWGKVKGSRRDILFINECNRIPYEVYRQLAVRTSECIFLDWNPDSEFWYEQKGLNIKDSTVEIHSTYKDNPYLSEVQIAEIESNKGDENWWKVYGLGQVGRPEGLVFTRWQQCQRIPEGSKLVGRGLDFGFSSDPTAIVDVYLHDGKLWLDERCWQIGMTNDMIANELRGLPGWTVADCAEPKSIAEVRNYGVRNIEPSVKGADSIRAGIQIMQRYEMMITQRSLNLIKEYRNYKWKEDRITGERLNEPIDKFNHCFTGDTMVATIFGEKRIDQIKVGDYVLTSDGYKRVTKFFDNGRRKVLHCKLFFCNFKIEVKATADHNFKTTKGWKQLQELSKGDVLYSYRYLTEKNTSCIRESDISQGEQRDCTEWYGNTITGRFLKDITCTTKMKIRGITRSRTLNLLNVQSILNFMRLNLGIIRKHLKGCEKIWTTLGYMQINGMDPKKGKNGIANTQKRLLRICSLKNLFAKIAGKSFIKSLWDKTNTAAITANQPQGEKAELTTKLEYVRNVERSLLQTNIQRQNTAAVNVRPYILEEQELKEIRVLSSSIEHVYDIEVEDAHEYFAQGVLVHNCIDAVRYVCLSKLAEKPIIKRPIVRMKRT